jgi:hypothetical protein
MLNRLWGGTSSDEPHLLRVSITACPEFSPDRVSIVIPQTSWMNRH